MTTSADPFEARTTLDSGSGPIAYYSLERLGSELGVRLSQLPYTIRILLENALRHCGQGVVTEDEVRAIAGWSPEEPVGRDIPFMPGRVLMQDFTGVPAIVDMAAMRAEVHRLGGDPGKINPLVPIDLVIDHSVQVDLAGTREALARNVEMEYQRNGERYAFLRWAQGAFDNLRVVPPGAGIVHQVNLEYLASVVSVKEAGGERVAFPDTLVGTDSHTTMINGLSVLGWGVGGIEAEAVLLGQPYYMLLPQVVGFRLTGALVEGSTATDLVLTVTQMLRRSGVVGKFVEFCGPGLSSLSLPDRATIANMSPEYGATVGFFPTDEETLAYLRGTGRDPEQVDLVERYARAQGLFRTDSTPEPRFSDLLELDMSTVEPSLAGPKRPQDKVLMREMKEAFHTALGEVYGKSFSQSGGPAGAAAEREPAPSVTLDGGEVTLRHGSVVIAAITSCTNTSNPSVMIGAGLLARNATERGLMTRSWVKASMAPGSRVVEDYLKAAGLLPHLEELRFHIVGYGCTTCIGNSGPLAEPIAEAVTEHDLIAASVLSGNRNFEGRVHPQVKANYLASPMLVVAYALAGRVDIDLDNDPLGVDSEDRPVYLRDIWPSQAEIAQTMKSALRPEAYRERYGQIFKGDERWNELPVPEGSLYAWERKSTYIRELPIFRNLPKEPSALSDIHGARVLAMLGDSITTDHISPAGSIAAKSPAGQYLIDHEVPVQGFNSYGSRRGNHEVMIRGTFANIRLRNQLAPGTEGGWTRHLPDNMEMTIYDAAEEYRREGVPTLVIAGKEYGSGSSRDWAAKGPYLLGVKATLAESYERIHRSNLVGMGVLPLQFKPGENPQSLGLEGTETFDIDGIAEGLEVGKELRVTARKEDGSTITFNAIARIDVPVELDYYRHGGVLQYVLRRLLNEP
ncbi:MAG: aconitate hydratase AcnA [Chloroflexi bacterium]|nr:aconitate hydratase AcnA [Chloroflexota bacterium]